jgi:hypothetical protein
VAVRSKYSIFSKSSIDVLIEFPSIPGNYRAPFHKEFGIQNPIVASTRSATASTRFDDVVHSRTPPLPGAFHWGGEGGEEE